MRDEDDMDEMQEEMRQGVPGFGGPGFGGPAGAPTTPPPAFVPSLPQGFGAPGTAGVAPYAGQQYAGQPYGGPGFGGFPPGGGFPPRPRPRPRPCLFRFTYIWLVNGRSFWFYPTYVDQFRVSGFRWTPRRGWRPDTIFRDQILWLQC